MNIGEIEALRARVPKYFTSFTGRFGPEFVLIYDHWRASDAVIMDTQTGEYYTGQGRPLDADESDIQWWKDNPEWVDHEYR